MMQSFFACTACGDAQPRMPRRRVDTQMSSRCATSSLNKTTMTDAAAAPCGYWGIAPPQDRTAQSL